MIIPQPYGLTFEDWAGATMLEVASGDLPVPDGDNWLVWASSLWQQPQLSIYGIPHPSLSPFWQAWAVDMMMAVGQ
jgi:hypothetical protein